MNSLALIRRMTSIENDDVWSQSNHSIHGEPDIIDSHLKCISRYLSLRNRSQEITERIPISRL